MYKVTWTRRRENDKREDHSLKTETEIEAMDKARFIFNQPDTVSAMVETPRGEVLWCASLGC